MKHAETNCYICGDTTDLTAEIDTANINCTKCNGAGIYGTGEWETEYEGSNPSDYFVRDREIQAYWSCIEKFKICSTCADELKVYFFERKSEHAIYTTAQSESIKVLTIILALITGVLAIWWRPFNLSIGWKIVLTLLLPGFAALLGDLTKDLSFYLMLKNSTDPIESKKRSAEKYGRLPPLILPLAVLRVRGLPDQHPGSLTLLRIAKRERCEYL